MKKILIVILFIVFCSNVFAQEKKTVAYITKDVLVGTWQLGSRTVGSGLNQHFIFKSDGTFILNLYSEGDDARYLTKLKGRYRLVKDELYFTIISRVLADGKLTLGDPGLTSSLFQFSSEAKPKELKELEPKEIPDPCYITVISLTNIKLNNQVYYKVKI